VTPSAARAPFASDSPLATGTRVRLSDGARFFGANLVAGGSPWRLLRLSGSSADLVSQWRHGGEVAAGQGRFARTLVQQGLLLPSFDSSRSLEDVEVIIPVLDDPDSLDRLLDQLLGFRVIVVDDASSDADAIAQCASRHGARLIRGEVTEGPAAARNAGVTASTAPLLWFLDVDVQVADARRVAASLVAHFDDPVVGAAAGRVVGATGPTMRDRFEQRHGALDLGPSDSIVVAHGRVPYVPAANLMVRAEALGDGFDETLSLGEDVDLVWRLADSGWLVRYDAGAVVSHPARTTWLAWWRQREGYGQSAAALKSRHPDKLEPVRVDAWTLATWLAVLARRPRLAVGIVASARRALASQLPDAVSEPERVAGEIVVRGVATAGAPLARAVVRTYSPLLVLLALWPRTRRPALTILFVGVAARWRHARRLSPFEVLPAIADDLAYASGVWHGAWRERRGDVLIPTVTGSTSGLRSALALKTKNPPPPLRGGGGTSL
jgi:mycofactocin system glycosyltransferase